MKRFVSLVLFLLLLANLVFAIAKPKMEDVAGKLSCFCGTCPHLVVTQCGCPTADKIKAEVQKKIDAGMTESQIINSFIAEYGNTVLSAPPKSGFDLTAWLLPFFGFFVGAGVLFVFLKRQRKDPVDPKNYSPDPGTQEDRRYRRQLQRELEERK